MIDPKYASLNMPVDKHKTNDSLMSIDVNLLNASGLDGMNSHDELSVIEPMEIHDDIPMKLNMIDHDFLGKTTTQPRDNNDFVGKTPSHTRGAPSLDLAALMEDIQATIDDGAQAVGISIAPIESKELAKEVIDNVVTQSTQKAKQLLRRSKRNEKSRKSLFRLFSAYVQKYKDREIDLAVRTITHGQHVPTDRLYHKEPSTRVQEAERKKREEDAITMANLAEFERLDNKRALLTDDEYFRWVYLHPELSAQKKQRFTNKRKKEIKEREQNMETQSHLTSRLSKLEKQRMTGGVTVSKKLAYAKTPKSSEKQRRASSSKPLVDDSKVTKRRTKGKPPVPSKAQSARKISRKSSSSSFGTWFGK